MPFPAALLLLALQAPPAAADPGSAALAAAALVRAEPGGLRGAFDEAFFRQISEAELSRLLAGLGRERGAVERVLLVSSAGASGHFYFDTAGWRLPAAVTAGPGGKIGALFFGAPRPRSAALRRAAAALPGLKGAAGLLVARLGGEPEVLEAFEPERKLQSSGASAVFLLAAMAAGAPEGRPAAPEVRELAGRAAAGGQAEADGLLELLGRRAVEAALPEIGCPEPGGLRPFLGRREARLLRSSTPAALKYLNLPEGEKYRFLKKLSGPAPAAEPRNPLGLGWPASPGDLCRAAESLLRRESSGALEALAAGAAGRGGSFLYAGRAAGAEPGAAAAVWLVKTGRSRWYCAAAAWNEGGSGADPAALDRLLSGVLGALEPL